MNRLEQLMAEFENELTFNFKANLPDKLAGLLQGNTIYINSNLPFDEAVTTLAEELGHHNTLSMSDITDYKNFNNMKLENKGRKWGYKKIIPFEKLENFIRGKECVELHEVAEHFEVSNNYIKEAVNMYRSEGKI